MIKFIVVLILKQKYNMMPFSLATTAYISCRYTCKFSTSVSEGPLQMVSANSTYTVHRHSLVWSTAQNIVTAK